MGVRLNLNVDDDIPAMLTALAGGERKRGEKVSELVRAVYESRQKSMGGTEAARVENELAGVAVRLKELEGRLLKVEGTLAAIAAERGK